MKSVLMSQYLVTTTLVAVDGHGTCKSLLLFFTAFYFQICLSFVCLLVVFFFPSMQFAGMVSQCWTINFSGLVVRLSHHFYSGGL
jgi:hypothetical protein